MWPGHLPLAKTGMCCALASRFGQIDDLTARRQSHYIANVWSTMASEGHAGVQAHKLPCNEQTEKKNKPAGYP